MHKLLAAGFPALLAVGLLVGSPVDQPREPRLDELHRARPVAAALEQHRGALETLHEAEREARFDAFLTAAAVTEASESAADPTPATTPPVASVAPSSPPASVEEWMRCTRAIESSGDYGAVSSGGTYRGAYQFHQGTWDRTAGNAGRHDLVGVDPSTVGPGDQDAMAVHLYDGGNGASHWGGRCT